MLQPSWRRTHRARQGQEEQRRTEEEAAAEPWGRGPKRWRRPCACRRGSRGVLKCCEQRHWEHREQRGAHKP